MKKFFLMLAVALPMFFMASCGDDNDEIDDNFTVPVLTKSNNTVAISNNTIALEWDDDMTDVRQAMSPFSYKLDETASTSSVLAYTLNDETPFYTYAFSYGSLYSAGITITELEDNQIDVAAYLKGKGYKDITTDDDEGFVFQDKVSTVAYDMMEVEGDYFITIVWTPNLRSDFREAFKIHQDAAKALILKKAE